MGDVWCFFFLIKDPLVRKTPSQVGLFQIEIFPFGKTGVNCHSKAFELLETPTRLDSQSGEYEGSAIRCHASLKSQTALIISFRLCSVKEGKSTCRRVSVWNRSRPPRLLGLAWNF